MKKINVAISETKEEQGRSLGEIMSKSSLKEIGMRVRSLRKYKNLSVDDLSKKVGITKGYLSRIENGLREPKQALLFKIAFNLDTTVSYLMGTSDEKEDYVQQLEEENAQLKAYIRLLTQQMQQNVTDALKLIGED